MAILYPIDEGGEEHEKILRSLSTPERPMPPPSIQALSSGEDLPPVPPALPPPPLPSEQGYSVPQESSQFARQPLPDSHPKATATGRECCPHEVA